MKRERGGFLYWWSNFIAIPTELFNKLFLSTRIARQRAKKRRGNDGSQKTGELQSFHSYTKPGSGVGVPAHADNFFRFLILQHSYIHKLCPGTALPLTNASFPIALITWSLAGLPHLKNLPVYLHSRGLFCNCHFLPDTRNNNQMQNFPTSLLWGFPVQRLHLIPLKFYNPRDQSKRRCGEECWKCKLLTEGSCWESPSAVARGVVVTTTGLRTTKWDFKIYWS